MPCFEQSNCQPECDNVFDRILVWPQISAGDTKVEWSLLTSFADPGPYVFQLQVGRTGVPDADDWTDVGSTVTDTYYALDSTKRVYGKFQWTHYRVKLTTGSATYYSRPTPSTGVLKVPDWNRAKEIIRMEKLRLVQAAGQEGYLLKRRLFGQRCTLCTDILTQDVSNNQCTECYGTGFTYGYYDPYPCFYVEQSTISHRNHLNLSRSTVDDNPVISGRMINDPQVFSRDVWVDKTSDTRWQLHSVRSLAEIRGVPLIVSAEMRLIPYSDIVYTIPIDGQVP